jgi:phage major head subunit gpT-like protein
LPGILSNAINKRIKAGWDYAEDAWRKVAEITSVSDYKAFSTYTLNAKGEYEEVPNGGTIPSGELAESSYENQVKRYGLMFSIDEMDIVNDDLGAINQRAFAFGRKAALKLNKVLWTKFQDDADVFKADNHNIVTSAGELNVENLGKLVKAFRKQTDANGDILGYEPAILLVPSNLEPVALKLFNDAEIRDNTASKNYTTGNPWRNRFVPVASAYLTSDDDYYLLADPQIAATMQVAFLNGQQAPVVESNPTSFDTFGISYRGKFSFGVAFADPKAGVKGDKA